MKFLIPYSRILILLVLCTLISFFSPHFLQASNIINILRQAAILNILGVGMTVVIITGGIDLSNGAVLALSSCTAAILLKDAGLPMPIGIIAAVIIGSCCGLINGTMVAKVSIPPFVITYAMMFFTRGLAFLFLQGKIIYGFTPEFRFIGTGYVWGVPMPIIISAVVTIIFIFMQKYTPFGSEIYAVGADEEASMLSGIRTKSVVIRVYILSGILSALAGIVYMARLNASEPVIGEAFPLDAIAAVLIGGTPLSGGEGGVGGTVIGALVITIIINAMNLLGISSLLQTFVLGALIIIMISVQIHTHRLFSLPNIFSANRNGAAS
ncbi:MAG: ABC transporter permease [Desulfobacterales bacterium]|nr:ABC transporter permease [Desulfobacterales bacterium]